jgi:hypothetical protein
MFLNLFFEKMNSSVELILTGTILFGIYWLALRKYNSLGLRLFILCFFLFVACCVWLYKDEQNLKHTLTAGEQHIATVISKEKTGNNDNVVEISFTANDGKSVTEKTSEYISQQEWNNFITGKPLPVIYVASTRQTYVQQSIMRFKDDKVYLYYFSGFWLLLGTVLYAWLGKLKVGVDEETGDEWIERKDGSIILDERRSKTTQLLKRGNIISKLIQTFSR